MAQEEKNKQLQLMDLCARLFYGVKVGIPTLERGAVYELFEISRDSISVRKENGSIITVLNTIDVLPYLRPMSSMTEEEWLEFDALLEARGSEEFGFDVDWLNARHFDFRGLIEKNLAIAVTEENNPYKR